MMGSNQTNDWVVAAFVRLRILAQATTTSSKTPHCPHFKK